MENENKQSQAREFLLVFFVTFVALQLFQYFFTSQIETKIENISIATESQVLPPNINIIKQDFGPYTMGFNTFTGNLESIDLHGFPVESGSTTPIQTLFNRQAEKQIFEEEFFVFDNKEKSWKTIRFIDLKILPTTTEKSFKTVRSYENFTITDTYVMSEDNPYSYEKTSKIERTTPETLQIYRIIALVNTNRSLIEGTEQGSRMFQGASFHTDKEKFKKIPFSQYAKNPFSEISKEGWFSFSQRYFATAVFIDNADSQESAGKFYSFYSSENATCTAGHVSDKIVLSEQMPDHQYKIKFYSGPEKTEYLKNFAPSFEYVIDYGMLWFISSAIMSVLVHLNTFIQNWGVSIIVMTLALRGVLQMMSFGQASNNQKMQAVKQKQQELAARYGDDQESLNRALLQFYKDEKINPIGSLVKTIFPLIFQIVMFLAFYSTLMEAVQLRQASFWYINDLSLRDPFYIMPIILVIMSYIQQFFTPKPEDETFAMFMRLSPLLFGFIAASFPAGLVLYWLTSTVFSLLQTLYPKARQLYATS